MNGSASLLEQRVSEHRNERDRRLLIAVAAGLCAVTIATAIMLATHWITPFGRAPAQTRVHRLTDTSLVSNTEPRASRTQRSTVPTAGPLLPDGAARSLQTIVLLDDEAGDEPLDEDHFGYMALSEGISQRAELIQQARARFDHADFDVERTRSVDMELRARLEADGIAASKLQALECRGEVCRAELLLARSELVMAGKAPLASGLEVSALDVEFEGQDETRVVAFMARPEEDLQETTGDGN